MANHAGLYLGGLNTSKLANSNVIAFLCNCLLIFLNHNFNSRTSHSFCFCPGKNVTCTEESVRIYKKSYRYKMCNATSRKAYYSIYPKCFFPHCQQPPRTGEQRQQPHLPQIPKGTWRAQLSVQLRAYEEVFRTTYSSSHCSTSITVLK